MELSCKISLCYFLSCTFFWLKKYCLDFYHVWRHQSTVIRCWSPSVISDFISVILFTRISGLSLSFDFNKPGVPPLVLPQKASLSLALIWELAPKETPQKTALCMPWIKYTDSGTNWIPGETGPVLEEIPKSDLIH